MRSTPVTDGENILATQYNYLQNDAYGGSELLVHQQSVPGMTLDIEPGVAYVNGTRIIYAGGNSPTISAPSLYPRIDVLSIDNTGTINLTTGTENASPSAPTYPANQAVLAEIYNIVGEIAIYDSVASGGGYVYNDVRPFLVNPMNPTAFTSDFIPDADGTRNLGSSSFEWENLYVKSGIFLNGAAFGSQIVNAFTAAESVTGGQAAAMGFVQSDGGVLIDANVANTVAASSGTATISFTVGSNSNRILVVSVQRDSVTAPGAAWDGTSMTKQLGPITPGGGTIDSLYTFTLVAPATGTHNLTITGLIGSESIDYAIHSYYNAAQTSNPSVTGSNASSSSQDSISISITPANPGALVLFAVYSDGNLTKTYLGMSGNQVNEGGLNTAGIVVGDSYQLGNAAAVSASGSATGGSSDWAVTAVSIEPYTAPVYWVYRASSALGSSYISNIPYKSLAFLGFFVASASGGETVSVVTSGIVTGLSGLIPLADYYLNDTLGTIGTAPGTITRKIGIALTATTLLITNIW